VVSARVSEAGLRRLNELKMQLGVGWDSLILDAVSEKHGVPVEELALPKAEMKAGSSEAGETKKGEA